MNSVDREAAAGGSASKFQELGFQLIADVRPGISEQEFDALLDRLIEIIEARNLLFGGGGRRDGSIEGFVTAGDGASATSEDREAIAAFLAEDAAIVRHEVGELCDVSDG